MSFFVGGYVFYNKNWDKQGKTQVPATDSGDAAFAIAGAGAGAGDDTNERITTAVRVTSSR